MRKPKRSGERAKTKNEYPTRTVTLNTAQKGGRGEKRKKKIVEEDEAKRKMRVMSHI